MFAPCEWLAARPAGHVRQLELSLVDPNGLSAGCCTDISNSLAAAFAACGAKGGLSEVTLLINHVPLRLGSWLAPPGGSLRRLRVRSYSDLRVVGPLGSLTALEHLQLQGHVVLEPGARLPLALTCLDLARVEQETLPQQVSGVRVAGGGQLLHACTGRPHSIHTAL